MVECCVAGGTRQAAQEPVEGGMAAEALVPVAC